jgi:hypothetical protein
MLIARIRVMAVAIVAYHNSRRERCVARESDSATGKATGPLRGVRPARGSVFGWSDPSISEGFDFVFMGIIPDGPGGKRRPSIKAGTR